MEEMVICKVGGGGGNITDEGYLDRLIDEAFVMVERLHFLLDKVTERILTRQSEEDWGLNSEVVGP